MCTCGTYMYECVYVYTHISKLIYLYKKLKINVLGLIPLKMSVNIKLHLHSKQKCKKPDPYAKYTQIYKVIENEMNISTEMLYSCLIDI